MEDKIYKSILFGIAFIIINLLLVSASDFGYDNPTLPNIPSPVITTTTTTNASDTNTSEYWNTNLGILDDANATQMEDSGGTLNIKVSWFTTLWNVIFGTKDTDDLTEGSTNLYDNRSWNETYAGGLYIPYSGATSNVDLGIYNFTTTGHTYSEDFYVGNYIQEQGDSGTFIQFPGDRHIHTFAGGYPVAEFIGGTPKGYLLLGDGVEEVDLIVYGSTNQKLFWVDSVLDRVNVSGSFNVVGDGNFTGNVTAENVWLPTQIFSYTEINLSVVGAGIWTNVTFGEAEEIKKRITHTYNDATNYTFTIQEKGTYQIMASIDISDISANAADHIAFYRILQNNEEIHGSLWATGFSKKDVSNKRNWKVLIEADIGDTIIMQFTSPETTVQIVGRHCPYSDSHVHSASIVIERVG